MAEAVPVRCPACQRENGYISPVFPCACGSPVTPPLDLAAAPLPLTHRTWQDSWVTVRCGSCGRESEWPHPEVGCGACGTVVLVPVRPPEEAEPGTDAAAGADAGDAAGADPGVREGAGDGVRGDGRPAGRPPAGPAPGGGSAGVVRGPASRPPFRPVTIRTARDAVATAALYLRWLGFRDVRQPDGVPIPSAAVDLRAPGVVAQVDPTTAPAGLRAVECVWLNGLTASTTSVYFALAGYTEEARGRADDLGIPLFVMDLTGMPQPVNDPADALVVRGA
ncbi:hypothetical protein GCM10010302_60260 [Streptomyces polychromogenes]|uniref:Restriction endonuclease n=1 Tax=Streptomyces polychromogenes TaxID=67342 RepID=A0ABN0VNN9_9ACTN